MEAEQWVSERLNRERVLSLALSACQTLLGPRGCQSEEGEQWGETCEDARFRATTPAPSTHRILQRMCVPHRMRQYPNANSEDVREERDSEEGCNSRGEDGWCEPRGLPWELRESIKKHSKTTTSDARRPLRRKFLLRRPVFGRAYRANVAGEHFHQSTIRAASRCVSFCLLCTLHAGRSFVE